MSSLLIKLFIKDYNNIENVSVRESYGKLAGAVGIITNVILATAKIITGVFFNSLAITADGINNLSDAGSSIVTLIGFKLAGLPSDDEHPFGHARYEYIAGLIVSIIIIILGVQLVIQAFPKILNPEPISFSFITIIVLIVAIVVKIWQAAFYYGLGKKIKSITLKATGTDSRNDVLATTAVLISILIGKVSGLQLDGIMGALVGIFIIYSGICLVRETISPLLGLAPQKELLKRIEEIIKKHEEVLGIHDLVVHEYGPGKSFATVHVEISANVGIMESHDLIDNIEREVSLALGIDFVIHMDPINTSDELTLGLKKQVDALILAIDERISMHDFRIVTGPTHTNLIFDVVLPRSVEMAEKDLKDELEKKIKEIDLSYYSVITIDRTFGS